ncbi:MAG: NmrA family NAD(P)-binding protein [Anaerolineaceae bacterium]|nr:NmrA family NAD(P)-binding protein [Anaerolineaceae bacterium]
MGPQVLLIGGTGMLGAPVGRGLAQQGFQVRVLTRSVERARARLGDEFEFVAGNAEDVASLSAALQGCQGVHISLDGRFDPDLERRCAANVVQAARETGVQRITYLSGASVCAENCWYAGTRAKFQAEAALRAGDIPYTIFRCHFFMETLHNFVRGRAALHIGRHPSAYLWVAAQDFARMLAVAYQTPATGDKTFYVCGPEALTMRQALQTFCQIAHPEARLVYLPLWLAGWIARAGRRRELQAALPFFAYCAQATTLLSGSPDEANALLGAPLTTLAAWSRLQAGR